MRSDLTRVRIQVRIERGMCATKYSSGAQS